MVLPETHYIYEDDRPICTDCNKHCDTYKDDRTFGCWVHGRAGVERDHDPETLSECHDAKVEE